MASTNFINYQTPVVAEWLNDANNAVYNKALPTGETIATTAGLNSAVSVLPTFSAIQGMKNRIINGGMDIAQRGTSFPAAVSSSYSLDRWQYANGGTTGVPTISQQADAPADGEFQNSLRVTVTTADAAVAAGDAAVVQQIIEGFNVRDLIGRTFTISFRVKSAKTGTHCIALRNGAPDRSYIAEYTVNIANTWESKTVTVPGGLITAGTWNYTNGAGLYVGFSLMAGTSFQTTPGAWQIGSFVGTSNQVNVFDTVGNIFAITGVQLEVGSIATPFEHRLIGIESMLCKRYYQKSFQTALGTFTFGALGVSSGTAAGPNWILGTFPGFVTMRNTPSIINSGVAGTAGTVHRASGVDATVSLSASVAGEWSGFSPAAFSTGETVQFTWASNAEL